MVSAGPCPRNLWRFLIKEYKPCTYLNHSPLHFGVYIRVPDTRDPYQDLSATNDDIHAPAFSTFNGPASTEAERFVSDVRSRSRANVAGIIWSPQG